MRYLLGVLVVLGALTSIVAEDVPQFRGTSGTGVSQEKNLGIRFQAIVPQQIILGT